MTKRKSAKTSRQVPVIVSSNQNALSIARALNEADGELSSFLKSITKSINTPDPLPETSGKAADQPKRNMHPYKTAKGPKVSTIATNSRRALVIEMVHEGLHDRLSIAQVLGQVTDIADLSNNKKAVAGTIYDLNRNSACDIVEKHDDDGRIVCVSDNCKYRK